MTVNVTKPKPSILSSINTYSVFNSYPTLLKKIKIVTLQNE